MKPPYSSNNTDLLFDFISEANRLKIPTGQYLRNILIDRDALRQQRDELCKQNHELQEKLTKLQTGVKDLFQGLANTCPICGGSMVGDGYTTVRHCEHADIDSSLEPDSGPHYCKRPMQRRNKLSNAIR